MSKFSKFAVVVLAIVTVAAFIPVSKAQTVDELNTQIQSLLGMIAQLQAQLAGGGNPQSGNAAYTYTADLTLGSTGADVSSLQQFLVSHGFLTMPAGASYGYFGPLTKSALASYQASVGIAPAVGYFGPITRAHFNAMVVVSPVPSYAPGVSPTPTAPVLTGGEGIITVDTNATPAAGSTYYEGDENVGLLGLKVKAQNGDLSVQRVKVDLGTSTTFYTKAFTNLSLYDGSTLLSNVTLDSGSVVKEGTHYYVYFSGLNLYVAQDTTKVLTIKGSIMGTVSTLYRSWTGFGIPANGVRAIDSLGLTQEGPGSAISRSILINGALTDQAQLIISKDSNSPKAQNIVSDSQGNVTGATIAVFDFKSKNDLVKVDQLVMSIGGAGTSATGTAAFLYDGSDLISSASISSEVATFTDMEDNFQIAKDSTKAITIKVTYSGANSTAATSSATLTVDSDHVLAYNSEGVTITTGLSGSPAGETMTLISSGPVIALSSAVATASHSSDISAASSSMTGTITLNVTAAGGDVYFTSGTSTLALLSLYNGDTLTGVASSSNVSFDSNFVAQSPATTYKLLEGQSGTITITGVVSASGLPAGNFYNLRLAGLKWGLDGVVAAAGTTSSTLDATVYKTTPYQVLP